MNTTPLISVDESKLVMKYRRFIFRAVYEFCGRINIDNKHPAYEDLVAEAQIAFVEECRKQNVDSMELTARQHVCVKNNMHYMMRRFFWVANNMGGHIHRKIDADRNYTFTDFESDNNAEFESRVPSYSIDDSEIDLESFYKTLPDDLRKILKYIVAGYNNVFIAKQLNVSEMTIVKRRRKAGAMYLEYLASAM